MLSVGISGLLYTHMHGISGLLYTHVIALKGIKTYGFPSQSFNQYCKV